MILFYTTDLVAWLKDVEGIVDDNSIKHLYAQFTMKTLKLNSDYPSFTLLHKYTIFTYMYSLVPSGDKLTNPKLVEHNQFWTSKARISQIHV